MEVQWLSIGGHLTQAGVPESLTLLLQVEDVVYLCPAWTHFVDPFCKEPEGSVDMTACSCLCVCYMSVLYLCAAHSFFLLQRVNFLNAKSCTFDRTCDAMPLWSSPLHGLMHCRDPYKIARRVGYAMFGVLNGTEMNPSFAQGEGHAN
jgi:hypothetical protein